MPSRRTPDPCSCGQTYADHRTGLTFAEVRRSMWRATDDAREWLCKSRHAVLGHWRELKLQSWSTLHGHCE